MARIERDWLQRIPGWVWVERPGQRRRRRPDEEGEPMGPLDEGDDAEDAEQAAADLDGEPAGEDEERADSAAGGHADEQAEDEDAQAQGGTQAGDDAPEPGDSEPTDAEPGGAEVPEELSLDVPEEVEQRRREEAERRRRTGLNRGQAPQAFGLQGHYLRHLASRFARMVSKVAEDSADLPSEGDEEWDMDELIKRRFTGRLISQCRMTREKRKVAVVLDTSPSCEHQARLFASIARVAEELGDCELYDAPNFVIMARQLEDEWERLPEAAREWQFKGRVVLAFGDFDGIERICEASQVRGNRIYWFCCEERPAVLESGRETFVKRYKGHYFATTNLSQLMRAMMRVR